MKWDTKLPNRDMGHDGLPDKTRLKGSPEAFQRAMARYRPDPIRLLFIAEAPPAYRANRLFYFNDLETGGHSFPCDDESDLIYGAEIGFTESDGYSPQRSAKARAQVPY